MSRELCVHKTECMIKFKEGPPDYVLMLAFTYKNEILLNEKEHIKNGGKFIIPLPEVEIIPVNGGDDKSARNNLNSHSIV